MNVLVVGHGVMGKNHVRVLDGMGHRVATLDPSLTSGATHHMLSEDLVGWADAVCIATPMTELAGIAAQWMERGKDVLVEKPAALTVNDLLALHSEAQHFGVRLAVGYTERFNPVVQALADQLHRVGHIRHINIRRLGYAADRGGDPALDLATHDLDVLAALGFDLALDSVVRTEHHVSALLFANHISPLVVPGSASVSIEASHLHPNKVRSLEVVGDSGVLQLDYQDQTLHLLGDEHASVSLPVDQAEPLQREWEAFFNGEGSTGIAALTVAEMIADEDGPLSCSKGGVQSVGRRACIAQ
jgi:UDP-N-acetylglucosamine 3-dehydrogenase